MFLLLAALAVLADGAVVNVMSISWDYAELSWQGEENSSLTLIYKPNNSSTLSYVMIAPVFASAEKYAIKPLEPRVSYSVWLEEGVASPLTAQADDVNKTVFTTGEAPEDYRAFTGLRKFIDHLLIMCLVVTWLAAVAWFYQQFSSIHLRLPTRYVSYKHVPKNIETVRVIERANDSIIYKAYSRQMSITMEKRATLRKADHQLTIAKPNKLRRVSLTERISRLRKTPRFTGQASSEVSL